MTLHVGSANGIHTRPSSHSPRPGQWIWSPLGRASNHAQFQGAQTGKDPEVPGDRQDLYVKLRLRRAPLGVQRGGDSAPIGALSGAVSQTPGAAGEASGRQSLHYFR